MLIQLRNSTRYKQGARQDSGRVARVREQRSGEILVPCRNELPTFEIWDVYCVALVTLVTPLTNDSRSQTSRCE